MKGKLGRCGLVITNSVIQDCFLSFLYVFMDLEDGSKKRKSIELVMLTLISTMRNCMNKTHDGTVDGSSVGV